MCILFCYIADDKIDIGYQLILLSNRDEDFRRPAIQAHVWKNTKYALGGSNIVKFDKKNFLKFFFYVKDKIKQHYVKEELGYV
jgi:uncharacterized protein with NRDE domain